MQILSRLEGKKKIADVEFLGVTLSVFMEYSTSQLIFSIYEGKFKTNIIRRKVKK